MAANAISAVLSQAAAGAPAGIQAWTGEIYNQWVNVLGLTQTNDTGQLTYSGGNTNAAQPTGTGVGNAVGFQCFTFNDTLALGSLGTSALNSGGSGYTNSSYTNLTVTGATSGASSARASLTVSGGVAGNLTITTAGSGYIAGEKLTVTGIGAGTGANWTATTLTSGSPVVLRMDYGAGTVVTDPQAWITVGTSTNGAGVINGSAGSTKMTQVACFQPGAPVSTITSYPSYYCYNPTYGFLKASFKVGANGAGLSWGQIYLYRSNTNGGAANGLGVMLIANSATTTGVSVGSDVGAQQCAAFGNGVFTSVTPSTPVQAACAGWSISNAGGTGVFQGGLTTTLVNGVINPLPTLYYLPGDYAFSAFLAVGLVADVAIGATVSFAIIGSTPLTFVMDAGGAVGNTGNVTQIGVLSLHQ